MADTVFHCCCKKLTRTAGMDSRSSWKVIAVSEGTPDAALRSCTERQDFFSNYGSQSGGSRPPAIYELFCEGDYLFLLCTRYYPLNHHGGEAFSHAIILPLREEGEEEDLLTDPDYFLSIEWENFITGNEDLGKLNRELTFLPEHEPDWALKETGLAKEQYAMLMRCV